LIVSEWVFLLVRHAQDQFFLLLSWGFDVSIGPVVHQEGLASQFEVVARIPVERWVSRMELSGSLPRAQEITLRRSRFELLRYFSSALVKAIQQFI
jgi:hypothetical protein